MSEIVALENRVTRLEDQITAGFNRLENIMQREISDLKTEQIKDLRESNTRIADDQRRLWEHVSRLELRDGQRTGGERKQNAIVHFVFGVIASLITGVVTWFSTRPPH